VVVNEIRYNSPGTPDVEFVEIVNVGTTPVDLTGWYLLDDDDAHDRCPLSGILSPGAYLVAPGRVDLFQAAYPGAPNVSPVGCEGAVAGDGFSLGNTSDTVRLFDAGDDLVDSVTYADGPPWPPGPDGDGPSLELTHPALANDTAENWLTSAAPQGTPGAENSVFVADPAPVVVSLARDPGLPAAGDAVTITAEVTDDRPGVFVELWLDDGSGFVPLPLLDDGIGVDGATGDDEFSATISARPAGTLLRYYVEAVDSSAQTVRYPAGAPAEYEAYTAGYTPPWLRLHEIVASNQNGLPDNAGDRDDWVEIYNAGARPVSLAGMFLSNDPADTRLSPLPATLLDPGESTVVWCDAEPFQGAFHMTFPLPREGGEVRLYDTVDHGNVAIAGYAFGPQEVDQAYGYFPDDGDAAEYLTTPTPFEANETTTLVADVCINEFLARSSIPAAPDWIELYNRGTVAVDISGWHLSDSLGTPTKYTFAPGTVLGPGAYLTVDSLEMGFNLAGDGSEVVLLSLPGGEAGRDFAAYDEQFTDVSRGRFPDGSANWHLFAPSTRAQPNVCDPAIPPFPPVSDILFETPAVLVWGAVDGARAYDVLAGDLGALHLQGPPAGAACAVNNVPLTEARIDGTPAAGEGRFFLVRAVNATCRFGTWDSDADSAEPRDAALEDVCP